MSRSVPLGGGREGGRDGERGVIFLSSIRAQCLGREAFLSVRACLDCSEERRIIVFLPSPPHFLTG